jgi:ankyrin repeat protein
LATESWHGHEYIVHLLLEQGLDANAQGGRYDFALHTALANGQIDTAQLLIKNGANVNAQVKPDSPTALVIASRYGPDAGGVIYRAF